MPRNRVEQIYGMAGGLDPHRVCAGAATDVGDRLGQRRESRPEQFAQPDRLQSTAQGRGQPEGLVTPIGVELEDLITRGWRHTIERRQPFRR
jgi:hypothetical protein